MLIVALGAVACQAEPPGTAGRVVADVILTVDNRLQRAVEVSLESDTTDYPLGRVDRRAARSFSLPSRLRESGAMLRLRASHDGEAVRSERFAVERGEKIVWTIDTRVAGTLVKE